LGEFNKAILDLQFASDISPDNKRIWLYLGDVFTKIGETAKASVFYSRGIALDPKYAEAFVGRAKVYEKMGKYERAQNDFDNAMAYASYRPERICLERGKYFSRRKKCEAAIADFRKAREIAPRLSEAWFLEAQALSDSGNKKRALDAIDHYIELKPQDEKGHVLKERLMAGLGIDSRPEMKQ
jgi:tetratricopeptide (TPR) repeat protein